uniref:Uncharacterized protein n=1 Tax=Knipowitschia caucasica TaxID=637954 RepID=A0AAV2KSE0_KNICA
MKELETCQSSIQNIEKNANTARSVAGAAAFMGKVAEKIPEEMVGEEMVGEEMFGEEMAEDEDDILSALTFFINIFAPVARFTVGMVQKIQTQKRHQAMVSLVVELKKIFGEGCDDEVKKAGSDEG